MSITEKIDALQRQVDELRSEAEAQAAAAPTGIDINSDPEVQQAAVALAKAIAKAQGIDMPMQVAPGQVGLPVMTLPPEFARQGGIGIGVMYAPPQQ